MHVEMDIAGSRLNYVAGDHVALYPTNDAQLVERIGELLDIDLDIVFSLTSTDGKSTSSFFLPRSPPLSLPSFTH